jgi:hypothetical protein
MQKSSSISAKLDNASQEKATARNSTLPRGKKAVTWRGSCIVQLNCTS